MRITPLPEVVVQLAHHASTAQHADGSFPPGHNGPYDDPETPVRNTSHWLITFSWLVTHGGDQRFQDMACRAGEYLMGPRARPCGHSFDHRRKPGKDGCNGLIGQAWTIEALAEASRMLGEPAWAKLAADVFLRHPFRRDLGLWERVEVDGSSLSLDTTFNHQLWFAAAGALLAEVHEPSIGELVREFLHRVPEFMLVHPDGLIGHQIVDQDPRKGRPNRPTVHRSVRKAIAAAKRRARGVWRGEALAFSEHERRAGYQSFNLYAFAVLKRHLPDHELWASEEIRRAVAAVLAYQYRNHLE
ncbi:MAG: agl cluster protein AglQ, partial [bacterium]